MTTIKYLLAFLMLACVCPVLATGQTLLDVPPPNPLTSQFTNIPPESEAIAPDPEYQQAFAQLLERSHYPTDPAVLESALKERREKCRNLLQNDEIKFLRQALIYSATPVEGVDPTVHGMACSALLIALDYHPSSSVQILAVLPLLDAKEKSLRAQVASLLVHAESDLSVPSLLVYGNFLTYYTAKNLAPPRALIVYIIKRDPDRILPALDMAFLSSPSKSDARRQAQWTDHVLADYLWKKAHQHLNGNSEKTALTSELANLANMISEWWCRLYIANVLDKYPELRTPDLVNLLKKDEDEAVKQTVSQWKPG